MDLAFATRNCNLIITKRNEFNIASSTHAMNKRHRACADSYLEWYEFEKKIDASDHAMAESLFGESRRYYALHGYTSMFRIDDLPPSAADMKLLADTMEDEAALACERTHACWTLGHLLWRQARREESLKIQRKGLKIKIEPSSRAIKLFWFPDPSKKTRGNEAVTTTNGERFDQNQKELKEAIDGMMSSGSNPISHVSVEGARAQVIKRMMETGGFSSEEEVYSMMDAMGIDLNEALAAAHAARSSTSNGGGSNTSTDPNAPAILHHQLLLGPHAPPGTSDHTAAYLKKSQKIVGACCDFCSKPAPESATSKLFSICRTCKRVAYCSQECQIADWKPNHKKSCRPPFDFKVGDLVRIQGLKSKPQFNSTILEVKGPSESPGRFICSIIGSEQGRGMSIKPENMRCVVPVEERMELKSD